MPYIDLHTHTTASDGTLSPSELVSQAYSLGLRAVAITDHDTMEGVEEALEQARKIEIEVIPGVEISVDFAKEMHILGYFPDPYAPLMERTLEDLRQYRMERNPQIVAKLNSLGFDITLEEIKQIAGGSIVGRPHIAKVLLDKGYVESIKEAFAEYLALGKPAYVKKEKLTPEAAIEAIAASGGLPVLAHPKYLEMTEEELDGLVCRLVKAGLKGIEVYYSTHSLEETEQYWGLAKKYQLLLTGGSDFHGSSKSEISLGKGTGTLRIDEELLVKLKEQMIGGRTGFSQYLNE